MRTAPAALAALLSLLAGPALAGPQQPAVFAQTICKDVTLPYLRYLPPGHGDDPARTWPVILFLHGSGERGAELARVANNGLPRELAEGRELPAVVVSPLCPQGARWDEGWMVEALAGLVDDALARYRGDPRRVYLTGLSMGGAGVWALGAAHPERFAALVPVCGRGDPGVAGRLRRMPVWAFHGARDDVVPVAATQEMVAALERHHGDVRVTIYPQAGHDSWTAAYGDSALYVWLLQQERTAPASIRPVGAQLTASSGEAALAFDGDPGTRWESARSDPQWLRVDLGEARALRRLDVIWEAAFASEYRVLASPDGSTWTEAAAERDGDGVVDRFEFAPPLTARFLRLDFSRRATPWGVSIWELELE